MAEVHRRPATADKNALLWKAAWICLGKKLNMLDQSASVFHLSYLKTEQSALHNRQNNGSKKEKKSNQNERKLRIKDGLKSVKTTGN